MRWAFVIIVLLHAFIHLLGVAKAFGWAEVSQLTLPISRGAGWGWLFACVVLLAAAVLYIVHPSQWWLWAFVGVVLSQTMIATAWADAKYGSVANVLIAAVAIHGLFAHGPLSLRAQYHRDVQAGLARMPPESPPIVEADLAALPKPVQCYLLQAGVLGQPRVQHFRVMWRGRIRGSASDPWMSFTAEQYNFVHEPTRLFFMDAERSGLPVDVFHRFHGGEASMTVRLLSMIPLAQARGDEMTRAETVTLLNDLCVMAPGGLIDSALRWEAIDDASAKVVYTVGKNTVSAVLSFNSDCELVDFVSDDRLASVDGQRFVQQRWSTPLTDYRSYGPYRLSSRGEGRWHPADGEAYAYIEMDMLDATVNGR